MKIIRNKDLNRIVKNGSLYIFGNIFNKAIAFITVPIFTRLLTKEQYGIVNTYSSWVSIVAVIIGLSMGQTIRNAFVDMREDLGRYISSMFTLAGINFGILFLLGICIGNHISIDKPLIILCLLESLSNFIINSLLMKYIMEEEAVKRTLLMILPNLLGAILSVVLIMNMQEDRQYGRIFGTCLSTTVLGVGIFIYYLSKYRTFIDCKIYRYILPLSIPLVLHGLACNILGTFDRTVITYYKGSSETGVYSLIYNLSMVASVVVSSAESVWIPKMTKCMLEKNYEKTNRDIILYVYIVTFAFCGLLVIAPELVLILGGKDYLSGLNMVFPIVGASYVMFIYSIYVNVEYFYKKTKIIALGTFVAAGANLVLNFVFIPKWGAMAAAYTTLVSYALSMILHMINAHKIDAQYFPIKNIFVFIGIFVATGVISNITSNMILIRYSIMITLGTIYFIVGNRKFRRVFVI